MGNIYLPKPMPISIYVDLRLRQQGLSRKDRAKHLYHEEIFMAWILEHNTTTEAEETTTGKAQTETGQDTAPRPEPKKRRGSIIPGR